MGLQILSRAVFSFLTAKGVLKMVKIKDGDRKKRGGINNKGRRGFSPVLVILISLVAGLLLQLSFVRSSFAAEYLMDLKVGISTAGSHLELSFGDEYCLFAANSAEPLPFAAGHYRLTNLEGIIEAYDLRAGCREYLEGPLFLQPVAALPANSFFQLHNALYGQEYRGALEIIPEGSILLAVNVLDLESYLRGVLPAEMPPVWGSDGGMEALKAQAIASRTFALYNQELRRHNTYHLCDQQHCQVYKGKDVENRYTDQALDETCGEVLTCQGRIIESFYHASNGGFTELSQNVWQMSSPYLASVPDPYDDPNNPLGLPGFKCFSPWTVALSRQYLGDRLAEKEYNIGEIKQVNIVSSYNSGRVEEIILQGENGRAISLTKENARIVLGLESQLFTLRCGLDAQLWVISAQSGLEGKDSFPDLEGKWVVDGYNKQMQSMLHGREYSIRGDRGDRVKTSISSDTGGDLIFEGRGRGHGVGMSQYGAYNRSRAGHSYREILSFYYPGAEVVFY